MPNRRVGFQDAVSKEISRRELEKRVAVIKKKGYFDEEKKMCVGCQRVYSSDRVRYPCLCPECVGKLRTGRFEAPNRDRTIAMQRFLLLRHWVEKRYQNEDELPQWVLDRVEKLQEDWMGLSSG